MRIMVRRKTFIYKNSKKGNVFFELVTAFIILLVVGITFIVSTDFVTDLTGDLKESEGFENGTEEYEVLEEYEDTTPGLLDGVFVFVLVGLWIITVVFALFIDTHPVFFVVSFIFLIFIVAVLAIFGNLGEEILADFDGSGFPMSSWVFDNFLPIGLVMGFSIVIALFSKTSGGYR